MDKNQIQQIITEYEKDNPPVIYDVNTGHPRGIPNSVFWKSFTDYMSERAEYEDPQGKLDAREAVAKYFNFVYGNKGEKELFTAENCFVDVKSTDIFVKLYDYAINFVNDGTIDVISLGPIYSAEDAKIKDLGGDVIAVLGDKDKNYLPTFEQMDKVVKDNRMTTCLIQLDSNNPTAVSKTREYIEAVARVINENVKDTNILVYIDEPYEFISSDGELKLTDLLDQSIIDNNLVISSSLSKEAKAAATGGFAATKNKQLLKAMTKDVELSSHPVTNRMVRDFCDFVVEQYKELEQKLQGQVEDPDKAARQLFDIGKTVAMPYYRNQQLLSNLLRGTLEAYGLDSEAMVGKHNASMYVRFYAGKNEKELAESENKNVPDLKSLPLSDEKILYGGKLSFRDVIGKDKIENSQDFQTFLTHLKGLEGCGGFSCRTLEIFGIPKEEAGVRLCHTNQDEVNIKAVESIYNALSKAFGLEKPKVSYQEIADASVKKADEQTREAFNYAADPKLSELAHTLEVNSTKHRRM